MSSRKVGHLSRAPILQKRVCECCLQVFKNMQIYCKDIWKTMPMIKKQKYEKDTYIKKYANINNYKNVKKYANAKKFS